MRLWSEILIKNILRLCALITVLTTAGILIVLTVESAGFFTEVPLSNFLTGTRWAPEFERGEFGILPLLSGTLLVTSIAILVAVPMGLSIAIYLNEYLSSRMSRRLRPVIELLASIPTVVYGFFALTVITPALQSVFPSIQGFNALSAGIVMGIMITPFISSLSQDALDAVPKRLKEAAYAMGSTRLQTAIKVSLPAASGGVVISIILAVSRAIGETMIVSIAAGQQAHMTIDPRVPIETITSYIVQVSMGDVQHGSVTYKTIFAAGIFLFAFTFILNNLSYWLKSKFKHRYE